MFERPRRLLRQIDFALAQAIHQLDGREVDQFQFIGPIEHGIRQCLTDDDAGDLRDDVIEAFDVLHVERGVDVDAGREQFVHVLPAFRVPKSVGVGVCQFIDEDEPRLPSQRRIEIEFAEHDAAVGDLFMRKLFETLEQRFRVVPAVRLDVPDHHVDPIGTRSLRGFEHRVGFADARRVAEENLELAARGSVLHRLHAGE